MTNTTHTGGTQNATTTFASGFTPAQPVLTPIRDHALQLEQA